jgi:hypothetical protein
MAATTYTWESCPLRVEKDSELVLSPYPVDDCGNYLLLAAAWQRYILPLGDRVVNVGDLDEYRRKQLCPPDIHQYMTQKLTIGQCQAFADYCVRVARMHAWFATKCGRNVHSIKKAHGAVLKAVTAAHDGYTMNAFEWAADAAFHAARSVLWKWREFGDDATEEEVADAECTQHLVNFAVRLATRG